MSELVIIPVEISPEAVWYYDSFNDFLTKCVGFKDITWEIRQFNIGRFNKSNGLGEKLFRWQKTIRKRQEWIFVNLWPAGDKDRKWLCVHVSFSAPIPRMPREYGLRNQLMPPKDLHEEWTDNTLEELSTLFISKGWYTPPAK